MKKLSTIIGNLKVDSEGTQNFINKHPIEVVADANGNGDEVFKGSNVKTINRKATRKGHDEKESAAVYEAAEDLDEKHLTKAELKKREEVAKAIERENPDMPMSKKMAIATSTAKKVAEDVVVEEQEEPKFDTIDEAVEYHKQQLAEEDDLIEAYTIILQSLYESLEDESDKQEFMEMMESDDGMDELTTLIEATIGDKE
jgi:hypothetical protein